VSDYTEAKRKLNALELKKTDILATVRSSTPRRTSATAKSSAATGLITGVERLE